jgi:hypothetical protein
MSAKIGAEFGVFPFGDATDFEADHEGQCSGISSELTVCSYEIRRNLDVIGEGLRLCLRQQGCHLVILSLAGFVKAGAGLPHSKVRGVGLGRRRDRGLA